jgi:hypothetical protein
MLLSCVLATGCSPPPLSIPDAPDMDALVEAYDQPSGEFDPAEEDEVRATLAVLGALVERTRVASYFFDVVENIVDETEDTAGGSEEAGLTLEADGYLRVKRICTGWVAPAVPDAEANGQLDLTTTFRESRLDPVIWGNAAKCRYLAGETRLELRQVPDTPYGIGVHWGVGVDIQSLAERRLLFALNLTGVVGEEELDLQFDFRTLTGRSIEYRIEQDDGSFVASINRADTVTLRAENGTFECEAGLACVQMAAEVAGD